MDSWKQAPTKGTASRLADADFCSRLEFLSRSWEKESLSPMQLLARGIEHGLTCESDDPGLAAGNHTLSLAVSRPIDTPREDLLKIAEHTSALADMIVWMLRTGDPWERPDAIEGWEPESYVGPNGLRRVVLCDHWNDQRSLAESFDWRTLEGTVYGVPMTLVVVVLGASRDGKRHGPLSKGWLHPRSGDLRFRKRDDTPFKETWDPCFRENCKDGREKWLEAMTEDRVLEECLILHEVGVSEHSDKIRALACNTLHRLADSRGTSLARTTAFSVLGSNSEVSLLHQCCPHFQDAFGEQWVYSFDSLRLSCRI